MRERVYIYDRDSQQIANAAGALNWARNLTYTTGLPGGFLTCSFDVPLNFLRGWDVTEGYKVKVYEGAQLLWNGRLEDLTRQLTLPGRVSNGWRKLQAFGYWQHTAQRNLFGSYAYTTGTIYSSDVITEVLWDNCPLISKAQDKITSSGLSVVSRTWSYTTVREVIENCLSYGNSDATPKWLNFALWEEESRNALIVNSNWHQGTTTNAINDWQWVGTVASAGTISMTSGYLRCNCAANADVAMATSDSALPSDKVYRIEHRFRSWPSGASLYAITIAQAATRPGSNPNKVLFLTQLPTSGIIYMGYFNTSNVATYWDGSAWTTSPSTAYAGSVGTDYIAVIYSDGTNFWLELQNTSGTPLETTGQVAWSATKNFTGDY